MDIARLRPPKSPALPTAPPTFERRYHDQLNNTLRLYFNQLDAVTTALLGVNGGQYIERPSGLFFCTADQTLAAANTATPVLFPTAYLSNSVKVNAGTDSRIYVDVGGIYSFYFSGQLVGNNSSAKQVYIWIKRDGVNIGYSTHQYTVAGGNVHLNIGWNFNIDMQPGSYLELEWAADSTGVTMEATAPAGPHPGVPSATMAVNFVAPLPMTLPVPP
jgi:hypothetical protein